MNFDIQEALTAMISAATDTLGEDGGEVGACITQAFQKSEQAFKKIVAARLDNVLDEEEMQSKLEDQQMILRDRLLVCKIRGKALVQQAVNEAIQVLVGIINREFNVA